MLERENEFFFCSLHNFKLIKIMQSSVVRLYDNGPLFMSELIIYNEYFAEIAGNHMTINNHD